MNRKLTALNIRHHREERRLTQQQVADHLGIEQSTYSDLEAAKQRFSAEQLEGLASLYKTTMDALVVPNQPSVFMPDNKGNALGFNIGNVQYEGAADPGTIQEILAHWKQMTDLFKQQLDQQARLIELLDKKQTSTYARTK